MVSELAPKKSRPRDVLLQTPALRLAAMMREGSLSPVEVLSLIHI